MEEQRAGELAIVHGSIPLPEELTLESSVDFFLICSARTGGVLILGGGEIPNLLGPVRSVSLLSPVLVGEATRKKRAHLEHIVASSRQ